MKIVFSIIIAATMLSACGGEGVINASDNAAPTGTAQGGAGVDVDVSGV